MSSAVGGDRAFLLSVGLGAKRRGELLGQLALGPRRAGEASASGNLGESVGAWAELARSDEFEGLAPELTGLVRSLHLPLEEGVDAAVTCCLDGRLRRVAAGDPRVSPLWCERLGVRGYAAAPVMVGGQAEAVLVVDRLSGDGLPPAGGEEVLAFLATHAGRAIAALRSAERGRCRCAQLGAVREVARALCETQGLAAGLSRLTHAAVQALGARGAALWLTDDAGRKVRLERAVGPHDAEENSARSAELRPLAEACVFRRESPLVEDAAADDRLAPEARGLGAIAGAPLMAMGRVRGALLVYGGVENAEGERVRFTHEDQELVALFASLGAVLVEQAGLAGRLSKAERRFEDAERQAVRAQALAQLGEMSVRMAHAMTSPLASISGFARRMRRAVSEGDPDRDYLEIVVREGERLERLVAEHLQYAGLQRFHLGLVSVNHVVQERLEKLSPEIVQKRVRLLKRLSPDLPALLLDGEKIGQAVHNVLASALEGVSVAGCIKVETRSERGQVVIEIAHDGPPLAGELLEHLFVPFSTGGRSGPGLGLAVAQRIVRDHGGEIGVRREGDWGQVLDLHLPVTGNEDRRRGRDRRHVAGDRRNRLASA
jgi:signal transduction histidine kinase